MCFESSLSLWSLRALILALCWLFLHSYYPRWMEFRLHASEAEHRSRLAFALRWTAYGWAVQAVRFFQGEN